MGPTPLREPPREERFSAPSLGSVSLRALHWGDPHAPLLVLLHGAGANAHWWEHLAPYWAGTFHVVAFDFRGHGDSDHPEELRSGAFEEDLAAALRHLGGTPPVLMGHSLGAQVALSHAARRGGVRALVLVDPARGASPSRTRATRLALSLRRTYADRERAVARFRFLPTAACAPESLRLAIAERSVRREADGRFGYKFDPRWFAVPPAPRPDLTRLECPVLLLRGASSPLLTEEGAGALASELPRCRLEVVEEAGHHVHIDRPEAVRESVARFLDELAEPAPSPEADTPAEPPGGRRPARWARSGGV